jgi:HAMP domain-containing protein
MKTTPPVLITLTLLCFGLLPRAQAVVPPPDGGYPGFNTAEGQKALFSLTSGTGNVAVGWGALYSDTQGSLNTAIGTGALLLNIGDQNTATGAGALLFNNNGIYNTANGAFALHLNTEGDFNTANGFQALFSNTTGIENTATGYQALFSNTTGSSNTALGLNAGLSLTTGSGNICIGAGIFGVAGESDTTRIRNIYASVANGRAVYVNSDDKIGTLASSRRFKQEIKPMDKASEVLFALKPVSFRYKKEVDPTRSLSFGLIAEEVAEVDPELVTPDPDGKPETVRYEAVNAMLLNEFLKEHSKVEKLTKDFRATVAQQQKEIQALAATVKEQAQQIQKVSAQLEASKPAPQVVKNNQ